jgi:hypothetical protein
MTRTLLTIDQRMTPPYWALLERQLLHQQAEACRAFYAKYFDERGYLLCFPRWGGNDGPDDAAENQLNWTMLHALGADDDILALFKQGWEGHLRQYTEAKTVETPLAREGMYFREFPTMFDWFHNAEGYAAFFLQGLSEPYDENFRKRSLRFAEFYMGEDPLAQNYDPEHRVIRSMFNGSRGPLLRKATALDWAGDRFDIESFRLEHGERTYEETLAHFEEYNDVVGDHPLNLSATTLAFNAFAAGGGERYRTWLLDYVDAWVERTAQNNGLIPTNVGLDGTLGGGADGKWYGGVYGWGFTVTVPQTGALAHRNYLGARTAYGFGNGLLMTGDQRYVDIWRGVIEKINENAREIDGQLHYPRMFGDEGWYHFVPKPFDGGALEVYYWSMDEADRSQVADDPWVRYLNGGNDSYPVDALTGDLDHLRHKMALMAADTTTPDTRLSDNMNHINPATIEALNQLMLGGLPTGRVGFPLHARLRYFDPEQRRAGVPADVAALVENMTADEVTVTLVNLNQVEPRTVVVQGGGYGEHRLESVQPEGKSAISVDSRYGENQQAFGVTLAPGCGDRLTIKMARYANLPTFAFPWG